MKIRLGLAGEALSAQCKWISLPENDEGWVHSCFYKPAHDFICRLDSSLLVVLHCRFYIFWLRTLCWWHHRPPYDFFAKRNNYHMTLEHYLRRVVYRIVSRCFCLRSLLTGRIFFLDSLAFCPFSVSFCRSVFWLCCPLVFSLSLCFFWWLSPLRLLLFKK